MKTLSRPRHVVPAEVTQDDALTPCFSSHTANKRLLPCLVPPSYVVVLFVVDFAEALARVPQHKKTVMCLREEYVC